MQQTWRKTGYISPSLDNDRQDLGHFPCPDMDAESWRKNREYGTEATEKNQFDKKGGGSKMNNKTRQKRNVRHWGRLLRRATALA